MSEATGSKPYSEDEAYLYETYVTEDGIEVPPPTKVMGPRRLARYREEVAEYLRANR
ncbi:MAG: sulfite reductase subunit alpha, partial [Rothia mucilaginosa]